MDYYDYDCDDNGPPRRGPSARTDEWLRRELARLDRLQKAHVGGIEWRRKQIQELEARKKALLEPQDVYVNGDIIAFEKSYGGRTYTFVATKQQSKWYSSSIFQNRAMAWSEMLTIGNVTTTSRIQNLRLLERKDHGAGF